MDTIYALCVKGGEPFYVGRTNDKKRRLGEHKRDWKTGTEAKYQFIRDLESKSIEWEMIPLTEVGPDCKHYEDFWVYTLILEGYELTNMKAGDSLASAERDAMLEMRGRGQRFKDAQSFLTEREREIKEAEARKRLQNCVERSKVEILMTTSAHCLIGKT